MLDASLAGEPTTWRSFYSDVAVATSYEGDTWPLFGETEWVDIDFDGDGVGSSADWIQFSMAMNPAARATGSWSCAPVSDDEVDCIGAGTDAFAELAGAGQWTAEHRYRVDNGSVVARIWLSSPGVNNIYNGFWYPEMQAYEEWVELTYPDRYAEMFQTPCCDYNTIKSPNAIALHKELMPLYLEAVAANET